MNGQPVGTIVVGTDIITGISLTAGEVATGFRFSERLTPPLEVGTIVGRVIFDANRNGTAEATETGLAGVAELLAGAGVGGELRGFDLQTFAEMFRMSPFESSYRGGMSVAAVDVDGDGRAEIVAGPGLGGGPRVVVLRVADRSIMQSFFAYEADFRGGVRVAAFDADSDGRDEVITGSGFGGGPRLRIIDGLTADEIDNEFVGDPNRRDGMFVG